MESPTEANTFQKLTEEEEKKPLSRRASKFELSLKSNPSQTSLRTGSADVVNTENLTFEQVWSIPSLRQSLKIFAAQSLAEENIMFIEDVLDLKQNNLIARVPRIYREYISDNSPFEVNITSTVKRTISGQFASVSYDIDIFDDAVDELAALIKSNIFDKYIQNQNTSRMSIV